MIEEYFQNEFGYVFLDKYEDLRKYFEWPTSMRAVFIMNTDDYYSTKKVNKQPRCMMHLGRKEAIIDEETQSLVVLRRDTDSLVRAFKWMGWRCGRQISSIKTLEEWNIIVEMERYSEQSERSLKALQRIAHRAEDLEELYDYVVVGGRKIRSANDFKNARQDAIKNVGKAKFTKNEFKLAAKLPYVERFLFFSCGFDVVLAENTIDFEGNTYWMPPLAVRFIYYGQKIDTHYLSPLCLTGHPHTSRSGTNVCLGQFQKPLYGLLDSGSIRDAMGVLWQWKNNYNQLDPYRMIYDFKKV